jgi:hypothetical protein
MKPTFRTLKIDDANALQALVVEHLESLEPSLKMLDERALLGGGTVDLVALDGEGRLVLIALAFVADDAMVLRMLDAFAWCLEYPDTVGRLYPVSQAALEEPPRVLFVSERLSDAFLRKVKHLRMPSIRCLEFCHLEVNGVTGLYFNPVETPRRPASAPAPASAPVVAPRGAASTAPPVAPIASARIEPETLVMEPEKAVMEPEKAVTESEKAVIEPEKVVMEPEKAVIEPEKVVEAPPAPSTVVDDTPMPEPVQPATVTAGPAEPIAAKVEPVDPAPTVEPPIRRTAPSAPAAPPPTGGLPAELLKGLRMPENLSSQWRRILSRAVDAPDPAKIRIVREYLQSEFPGAVVYDFYEHKRASQVFQVQNGQGVVMHLATIADDFFDGNAADEVRRFLERQRLSRALRDAGSSGILISAAGVRVAKG